ncbi:hypothetical protein BJ138DRAFT_1125955 [Hygrophoropsis aurantiaca]|uniref:Uncharacterized protein n=1 Tax=Hygrophoropsis aurantiaca TaxID=72124 RepID=A0ACB8AFS8_9AGAM|nr:hypothetical protein BJ138DRAFT_1125955 [Hygrophoropsis aurantiaca]
MLGARTKQVFAYGRRGHRIINVSDHDPGSGSNPIHITDSPFKSNQRENNNHGNTIYDHSPSPPRKRKPKAIAVQKRSPAKSHSPLAVKMLKKRLAGDGPKSKKLAKLDLDLDAPTPRRQPLTPLHSNYASPLHLNLNLPLHAAAKKRSTRVASTARAPKPKPVSPVVAVDITLFDDHGRRLSQEHRVARTDVQINPVTCTAARTRTVAPDGVGVKRKGKGTGNLKVPAVAAKLEAHAIPSKSKSQPTLSKLKPKSKPRRLNSPSRSIIIDSDSPSHPREDEDSDTDTEVEKAPRPPKKLAGTRRAKTARIVVISSDESESEGEGDDADTRTQTQTQTQNTAARLTKARTVSSTRLAQQVQVVIPPPAFKLPKVKVDVPSAQADASNAKVKAPKPTVKSKPKPPSKSPSESSSSSSSPPPTPPPPRAVHAHTSKFAPAPIPPRLSQPPPTKPQTHARPLTPIKRGLFRAPCPPTPSTPTECDLDLELELELEKLDLSPPPSPSVDEDTGGAKSERELGAQPAYLRPLLSACGQASPHEFSAFIETFPFDPIVRPSGDEFDGGEGDGDDDTNSEGGTNSDVRFKKIGEASYSEVFGIGDVVLKVIPLRAEDTGNHSSHAENPNNNAHDNNYTHDDPDTPAPSDARDVLKEMIVTRELGAVCAASGFVRLLRTYVVRGRYPSLLLDLWDAYEARKGSEGVRPDGFPVSQVYAIIVLPNGGPDLEAFAFKTRRAGSPAKTGTGAWHQACGVFWQVARALEQAEDLVAFEHRDLHWGQILVRDVTVPAPRKTAGKGKLPMDDVRFGVRATIIDLGLSRMEAVGSGSETDTKTYWTPFDEEIFEGEGDYQFDVYRMMRAYNGDSWEEYRPLTNVMWLHYLVQKLLHSKRLKPPSVSSKSAALASSKRASVSAAGYDERECYECLVEMERVLKETVDVAMVKVKPGKGRRRTVMPAAGLKPAHAGLGTAGAVVGYGALRGWME